MKTREYAVELRKIADYLDTRPEFDAIYDARMFVSFWDKEKFLDAARCLGDATKSVTDGGYADFRLTAKGAPIILSIPRDKVCKKTVVYDCEPLFSAEELEAV